MIRQVVGGSTILIADQVIFRLAILVVGAWISTNAGSEAFGLFQLVVTLAILGSGLLTIGMPDAAARNLAIAKASDDPMAKSRWYSTTVLAAAGASAIGCLLLAGFWVVGGEAVGSLGKAFPVMLLLAMFSQSLVFQLQSASRSLGQLRAILLSSLIRHPVFLLGSFFLLPWGGWEATSWAFAAGAFLQAILLFAQNARIFSIRSFRLPLLRSGWAFGKWNYAWAYISAISDYLAAFIVGATAGLENFGSYSLALLFAMSLSFLGSAVQAMTSSLFSGWIGPHGDGYVRTQARAITRLLSAGTVVGACLLLIVAEPLVPLFFPGQSLAVHFLTILTGGAVFFSLFRPISSYSFAQGKLAANFTVGILTAGAILVLLALLVPTLGVDGAALATFIGYSVGATGWVVVDRLFLKTLIIEVRTLMLCGAYGFVSLLVFEGIFPGRTAFALTLAGCLLVGYFYWPHANVPKSGNIQDR